MHDNNLHRSARAGDLVTLRAMVAGGTDINLKDKFGTTALQCAIAEKQSLAAIELINLGADIATQDPKGLTALHYAIEHGLPDGFAALTKRCPSAALVSDKHGNQPLWTAAFNARGNYEMVSIVLNSGSDPGHLNNAGLSPLEIARRRNDSTLLKLLETGGDREA